MAGAAGRESFSVVFMTAIPGPQHQLVVALVNRYPELSRELAELLDGGFPAHDRVQAAPNTQQAKRGGVADGERRYRPLRPR